MSHKLHRHWQTFQLIKSAKSPEIQKSILKHYSKSDEFCSACREISKNIVRRKFIIDGNNAKKLKKYKKIISKLAKKKNSKTLKRKLVNQSGGWLSVVVPLIASAVGEIIRSRRK